MDIMKSWYENIDLMKSGYCDELCSAVMELRSDAVIYPAQENLLYAFKMTSFDNVKVVILGQDPYHGEGQAHGLAFSVNHGVKAPPSLKNIFKEIESDIYTHDDDSFFLIAESHDAASMDVDLTRWAEQGVLLLNTSLSVEASKAGSHRKLGWHELTDQVIQSLSSKNKGIVFMLWGGDARKKVKLIDSDKHLVLESVHPSPLSVYRGFFGCKHFSQANAYLEKVGKEKIIW